jgi:DNA-binding LytR/AlgR family response regulator
MFQHVLVQRLSKLRIGYPMINILKMGSVGRAVSNPEGACDLLADRAAQHSGAPIVIARDAGEQTAESMETFQGSQALAKPHSLRVAIKVGGKILFINLGDVVAVQAEGKCVLLQQNASSFLLRESISVVAERLETHGFIRIHRSVLVNTSFVEEIRPLSTGEYRLRVEGGKEYTVTRTYKKNLKSLAEFWMGKGAFFPG